MELTSDAVCRSLDKNKGYPDQPDLNDILYLQHMGLNAVGKALQPFTSLKTLFLDHNTIPDFAGIGHLSQLRSLYASSNRIGGLHGLQTLTLLHTLDVSHNDLRSLEGLAEMKALVNLHAQGNRLTDITAASGLPLLRVLDLSDNKLSDPGVLDTLDALPGLRCLYLKGNELVSKVSSYRRALISRLPSLTFLDDRAVAESERVFANAWASGGPAAEAAARKQLAQEKADAEERRIQARRLARGKKPLRIRRDGEEAEESESDSEPEPEPEPELKLVESRRAVPGAVEQIVTQTQAQAQARPWVWTSRRDRALLAACQQCVFDFGRVAAALNSQTESSSVALKASSSDATRGAVGASLHEPVTATACRLRFAELEEAGYDSDHGSGSGSGSDSGSEDESEAEDDIVDGTDTPSLTQAGFRDTASGLSAEPKPLERAVVFSESPAVTSVAPADEVAATDPAWSID